MQREDVRNASLAFVEAWTKWHADPAETNARSAIQRSRAFADALELTIAATPEQMDRARVGLRETALELSPQRLDDLHEGADIRDYIALWDKGTALQATRALGLPDDVDTDVVEIDVHLFVVALRNLVRAVAWGRGHAYRTGELNTSSVVDTALNAFDKAMPGLVDVRDIHEHFDDYARGKGNLGLPKHLPRWWEYDEHNTVVNVAGYRIDVVVARDAARLLADKALEALP